MISIVFPNSKFILDNLNVDMRQNKVINKIINGHTDFHEQSFLLCLFIPNLFWII